MIIKVLILALSVFYGLYTSDINLSLVVLVQYFIGFLNLKYLLRVYASRAFVIYDLFYFIYGLLTILTQIELIHDPFQDYFIHTDAAWSFFSMAEELSTREWSDILSDRFFLVENMQQPLAIVFFAFLAKICIFLGIINLRLFLRLHIFLIGSTIITLVYEGMSKYNNNQHRNFNLCLLFGLCSYLFITSAIFTRDIHVCFMNTLVVYTLVKFNNKWSLLAVILFIILAFGFRPGSGFIMAVFPICFYYHKIKDKMGAIIPFFILIVIVAIALSSDYFTNMASGKIDFYSKDLLRENKADGMFMRLHSLPFPINVIISVVYMFLMPLPITTYLIGTGNTFYTLPFLGSPFVLFPMLYVTIVHLISKNRNRLIAPIILASFISYFATVFVSPDLRRAFATVPALFMCYGIIIDSVSKSKRKRFMGLSFPMITAINIFFILYLYIE